MAKIGLVLAGGGGKGAYQIGVWKYLNELGLDSVFDVISGTSVGGLNAVLFAQGDYALAEKIWKYEIKDRILKPHSVADYLKMANAPVWFNPAIFGVEVFNRLVDNGVFSREGLVEIIDNHIDLHRISKSNQHLYVTCTRLPEIFRSKLLKIFPGEVEYFSLNNELGFKIKNLLLATSAIPGVFEPVRIGKHLYYDGGLRDNVPVIPVKREGCDKILVIHLGYKPQYKTANDCISALELSPSEEFEDLKDTLDFSPEGVRYKMDLGYNDAKNIYGEKIKKFFSEELKLPEHTKSQAQQELLEEPQPEIFIEPQNIIVEDEPNMMCLKCHKKFYIQTPSCTRFNTGNDECIYCGAGKALRIR